MTQRSKRFAALYEGTWRLEPDSSGLKLRMIGEGGAQIYVPIVFTIGTPGQPVLRVNPISAMAWI